MRYELKKILGFKEIWIGGLLFTAYLLLGVMMEGSNTQDWALVFQFISRYGVLLFPGFLIIGLSRLFCYEYSEHTDALIHACRSGKIKTFRYKISASVVYMLCVAVFISGIALIAYTLPIGMGADAYAHIEEKYKVFSLNNVGIYAFQVFLMIAGGLSLLGFILLLSTLVKRGAVAVIIGGGLYGFLLIFDTFSARLTGPFFRIIENILHFGPVNMIRLKGFGYEDLFAFEMNYTGGAAIAAHIAIPLIVTVIIAVLELSIAYMVWTRRASK